MDFFDWRIIASLAMFALNNWWLKYEYGNFFTGKLSDFLFCFFFPVYISTVLSFCGDLSLRFRIYFGAVLTLAVFVPMKVSVSFSNSVSELFSILTIHAAGEPSVNHVDKTDLLATPMVIVSIFLCLKRK